MIPNETYLNRLNSLICTFFNFSLHPPHKWVFMSLVLGIFVAFDVSLYYFLSLFLPFLIMMIVMFIDIILWPTFNNKTTLYKSLVLSNAATDANLFPTFINLSLLFSIIRSSHFFSYVLRACSVILKIFISTYFFCLSNSHYR